MQDVSQKMANECDPWHGSLIGRNSGTMVSAAAWDLSEWSVRSPPVLSGSSFLACPNHACEVNWQLKLVLRCLLWVQMVVCICLSPCGPVMNCWLIQDAILPLPYNSELRLQQTPELSNKLALKMDGWMGGFYVYQWPVEESEASKRRHALVASECHFNRLLWMPSTNPWCLSYRSLSLNSGINCPLVYFVNSVRVHRAWCMDISSIMIQCKNNSLRFRITSSAKLSRRTILKPCQDYQI